MKASVNNNNGLLGSLKQKLDEAPLRITGVKKQGKKVIGYFGPYIPEELILAAGMHPLHLAFGGETEPASAGEAFLKSYSCTFARSCLGYKQLGKNPYFDAVDAVCVARTCDSMKRVQEYWGRYLGVPAIPLGVPQTHDRLRTKPQAIDYFKNELLLLKKKLEEIGGREIKNKDINQAIILCNGIRENLWTLYEYPVDGRSPIEWHDVFWISNAGFLIDRSDFRIELEKICLDLQQRHLEDNPYDKRARLMICGNTIGFGDNKVLDIVRQSGGNIVADATCSGSMFARRKVKIPGVMGDPMDFLTERYLYNFPCPFMTDLRIRINNIVKVARDYQVHGLVFYTLKYCDTWRADYKYIQDELYKELSVPTLLIETDYSPEDSGAIKEKVEAFIKRIEGQL